MGSQGFSARVARGQCHVRSIGKRVFSGRAGEVRTAGFRPVRRKRQFRGAGRQQCGRQQQRQSRARTHAPAPRRSDDSQASVRQPRRATTPPHRTRQHPTKPRATIPTTATPPPRHATTPTPMRQQTQAADTARKAEIDPRSQIEVRCAEVRQVRRNQAGFRRRRCGRRIRPSAAQDGTAVVTADAVAVADPRRHRAGSGSFRRTPQPTRRQRRLRSRPPPSPLRFAGQRDRSGCPGTEGADTDATPAATANRQGRRRQDRCRRPQSAKPSAPGHIRRRHRHRRALRRPLPRSQRRLRASKAAPQLKNPGRREGRRRDCRRAGQRDRHAPTATATPTQAPSFPPVTPQTEAAGKPKAENGIVDAAKADVVRQFRRRRRQCPRPTRIRRPPMPARRCSIHPATACRLPARSRRSNRPLRPHRRRRGSTDRHRSRQAPRCR